MVNPLAANERRSVKNGGVGGMFCCSSVYCRCNRGVCGHRRAIAGQRLRHAFVGLADDGALRIELWIAFVGAGERSLDRLGIGLARRGGKKPHRKRNADRDNRVLSGAGPIPAGGSTPVEP